MNVFSLPYDFLSGLFFSLAYSIVRTQCTTHITCNICVNQLFVPLGRLVTNRRLLVQFWGCQELHAGSQLRKGTALLTLCVFKGQLYTKTVQPTERDWKRDTYFNGHFFLFPQFGRGITGIHHCVS